MQKRLVLLCSLFYLSTVKSYGTDFLQSSSDNTGGYTSSQTFLQSLLNRQNSHEKQYENLLKGLRIYREKLHTYREKIEKQFDELSRLKTCPRFWKKHDNRCFYVGSCKTKKTCTWNDAKVACQKLGGYLASVLASEDNDFFQHLVGFEGRKIKYVLLGGTDIKKEGEWRWQSKSVFKYTNWYFPIEPNNYNNAEHCLMMWPYKDGKWNDCACDEKFPVDTVRYVCEQ